MWPWLAELGSAKFAEQWRCYVMQQSLLLANVLT
jgi:hypothetical protein